MKAHIATAALAFAALLGCSTPKSESLAVLDVPPPEIAVDLPLEPPPPAFAHACKLGESCLALDPRPFEVCLVGTKRCADKAREPLQVDTPTRADAGSDVVRIHQGSHE